MKETAPGFRREATLDDGTIVVLRHVRAEDAAEVRRGFESLSPASRYRRFLAPLGKLTDDMLRYLVEVDGNDHVAIVAITADRQRGVGIARFIRMKEEREVAEAAVTVVDDLHGRGLGRLLGETIATAARERGVRHFRAEVLASNEPMRAMLAEAHAAIVRADDDTITFDVPLEPPPSAPNAWQWLLREAAGALAGLIRALPITADRR